MSLCTHVMSCCMATKTRGAEPAKDGAACMLSTTRNHVAARNFAKTKEADAAAWRYGQV